MKFHPRQDYLLVKPVAVQETKTRGGLIVIKNGQPASGGPSSQPTMIFAEVVEAGPNAQPVKELVGILPDEEPEWGKVIHGFSVGDIVAFHPGQLQIINDGASDFALIKATGVLAVVEDFAEEQVVEVQ